MNDKKTHLRWPPGSIHTACGLCQPQFIEHDKLVPAPQRLRHLLLPLTDALENVTCRRCSTGRFYRRLQRGFIRVG